MRGAGANIRPLDKVIWLPWPTRVIDQRSSARFKGQVPPATASTAHLSTIHYLSTPQSSRVELSTSVAPGSYEAPQFAGDDLGAAMGA